MRMYKMELLRVGKDSQGDEFTNEALQGMVDDFKPGTLSVGIGFDPTKPSVGTVKALSLVAGVLSAHIEVDNTGEAAVTKGLELASGGEYELRKKAERGHNVISKMRLTGTALTDEKVK